MDAKRLANTRALTFWLRVSSNKITTLLYCLFVLFRSVLSFGINTIRLGTSIFAQPQLKPPNRTAYTWFCSYFSAFGWIVVLHLLPIFYHFGMLMILSDVVLISFNSFLGNVFAFHCETCYISFYFSIVLCSNRIREKYYQQISIGIRTLIMWFR